MEDDGRTMARDETDDWLPRRRLRSYRERDLYAEDSDSSEREWATAASTVLQGIDHSNRARPEEVNRSEGNATTPAYTSTQRTEPPATVPDTSYLLMHSPSRGRMSRRTFGLRGARRRGGPLGIPSQAEAGRRQPSTGDAANIRPQHALDPASLQANSAWSLNEAALDELDELAPLQEEYGDLNASSSDPSWTTAVLPALLRSSPSRNAAGRSIFGGSAAENDDEDENYMPLGTESRYNGIRTRVSPMKRSREKFENAEGRDALTTLTNHGAVSVILYHTGSPDPGANDVWPNLRSAAKLPAKYYLLRKDLRLPGDVRTAKNNVKHLRELLRPAKQVKTLLRFSENEPCEDRLHPQFLPGWPPGCLPTELFEEIAGYLNRDDIKSMRLVCREFDRHISQVLFKTVVVPFNTEIYGMLNQEKPDFKGKKKVRVDTKGLHWKNANGDDVYNGHGLDVFRGFGEHILSFGMSFEVNEDSLSKPPDKSMTERHLSFWGSYDWPFEEYRRFDDVAGLETAADETPRMTVAFSELSKVRELALSIDSGLGWLNGPDRSIRARILQRPPTVFGTAKNISDRRAQAQRELWEHIEACHLSAGSEIKLATLYRMETSQTLTELQGAPSLLQDQPQIPFLDPHLIYEAVPHDTADVQVPASFEDPEALDRFIMVPAAPGTGILFTSAVMPTDAGQLVSPIIPANLTKAQKEWLLETEWAQRAFLSSYMLSVIDNPRVFHRVHTLNISQLSDRYLSMLNREDFWNALPSLRNVTLRAIPGWRTVSKDEAGFVETPKISPSSGINSFYDILRNMVCIRKNIQKLSLGWATGGEHAEGMHARNRLLLPAPLLPADRATEQHNAVLSELLLKFPYVEELTLQNCWISPAVLCHLVKQHDQLKLKHLTLDSVSLTAVLRNQANVPNQNHAQQVAGFLNQVHQVGAVFVAPGVQAHQVPPQPPINAQHFLHFHVQALQMQIQQMQTQGGANAQPQLAQLQAQLAPPQLAQFVAQLHHLNNMHGLNQPAQQHQQPQQAQQGQLHQLNMNFLNAFLAHQGGVPNLQHTQPPPAPAHQQPPAPPAPNPSAALRAQPREGSWLNILDIISPGPNLSHFGSEHSQADSQRTTSLERIEFISCGYAKLPYALFDQAGIENAQSIGRNPMLTKKYNALAPAMLSSKWPLLGEIVQEVDTTELAALNAGWDLETGWEDGEAAQGPEFDGLLPGGTGRFTGVVIKQDFDETNPE